MSNKSRVINHRQSALFITYDGLLDPLGRSQILPYLYSIAEHPRHLHIVSFEKHERFRAGADELRDELKQKGIDWTPLSFTSRFGKIGKAWDLIRMYSTALQLQAKNRFDIAHCRSYQAMQVGCFLHHVTGVKTIFDMRGLWVDDRVDRGLWPQDRWLYRLLYRYYKRVEKRLLECADSVVVLTERVVPEIREISPDMHAPIKIIPCCADFKHFAGVTSRERLVFRDEIGINKDALVLLYLGSLGAVYLFSDMLHLFETLVRKRNDIQLLLITKDWSDEHEELVIEMGLSDYRDRIHIKPASRDEVPKFLCASDVMLNFISPSYSMMACSPTKMAEALAVGIPIISNTGVGDVDLIMQDLDAGLVIDLSAPNVFDKVATDLEAVLSKGGERLRARARLHLGLDSAIRAYASVYEDIEGLS